MTTQILEPNRLFIEESICFTKKERSEEIIVSELVKKDQPILSWPKQSSASSANLKKRSVNSGRNTHFSDDGNTLIASTVGYPRVDSFKQENSDESILLISVDPLVRVSDDAMQATLSIHPATKDGLSPGSDTLLELLSDANINFGVDELALQKALDILDNGCTNFHDIPIATGVPSQAGMDELLQFAFEIGPIAGTVLKDGSIDFRERKIMIGVSSNELLATRIEAIPGTPGTNVKGEEIEPEGGNTLDVKILNDTTYSKETGEIRATKDGVLTVVNGSHIRVCSRQVINSDINYETGNVESKNCVSIQGSVQPGFKVEANGDIEVRKEVMSGNLQSKSNIVVKGGITGKNTIIQSGGDVDIFFIEHGKITSGGNVIVRKQTYYSEVAAGGSIRYQPGTKLIGGNLTAGRNITTSNVGSENSPPSNLAAGVDFERLQYYYELRENRRKQQEILIQWMQRHGNAKSRKVRVMEKELDETKMKLLKLNLIPDTLKYSRVGALKEKVEQTEDEESIEKNGIDISKIHIDIQGTMYRGTELRIGNQHMTLTQTISNRRIKLNKTQKRLIATPLKGA